SLTRYSLNFRSGPVGPGFFKTTGIALVEGREFSDADTESSEKVAVISNSTAHKLFPDGDSIGRRLPPEELELNRLPTDSEIVIVGVAGDVRRQAREQVRDREVYIPYTQAPPQMLGQVELLVRGDANRSVLIPAIRQQVQSVDKDLSLINVQTVANEISSDLSEEHSLAALIGLFGALALGLAAIGLYGTLSYSVGRRAKELAIRMALGAERKAVLRMILSETVLMVITGVAIGIPVALLASRLISGVLFGIRPADPQAISAAAIVMLSTGLVAAFIPARRASRVDPAIALRCE
ncbi:MAG: FtsX-like permease family protein, partial [Blastocatellia bacterium]